MIFMLRWTERIRSRKKYMLAGVFGAVVHMMSLMPIFFGLSTAYQPMAYGSTILVLPMFVLYTYWASSGKRKVSTVNTHQYIFGHKYF